MQKIFNGQLLLFFAADVENDAALVHHDQTIAVGDGVLHIVCDHQSGQAVLPDDLITELQDLCGGCRVQRRGMFIQEQQFRLLQGGHQQGDCLPLSAGEQTDFRLHAVFQSEAELRKRCAVQFPLFLRDTPGECSAFGAAVRHSQIFFDHHGRRGAHHRILENSADVLGSLGLIFVRQVLTVKDDTPAVRLMYTGNEV